MDIDDTGCCGGRGQCSFCGEWHNNVSYHEAHECEKSKELEGHFTAKNVVCPNCLELIDAATSPYDKDNRPREGDLSVCLYCSAILKVNDDLSLSKVEQGEIDDVKENEPELFAQLMQVQAFVTNLRNKEKK